MTKNFKFLKEWTLPSHYMGATWEEYYVFLTQHRDSDTLTRCNFIEGLKSLGGENETVQVIRESHWAVGWIEWIGIHKSNVEALDKAENMLKKIDSYPILNEDAFSEMEYNEYNETWQTCYKDDFLKDLKKAFGLRDSTINFLKKDGLEQALYEKGIPSGEYFTSDNSGVNCHPEMSIERLERQDIADFLKKWRKYYKEKAV